MKSLQQRCGELAGHRCGENEGVIVLLLDLAGVSRTRRRTRTRQLVPGEVAWSQTVQGHHDPSLAATRRTRGRGARAPVHGKGNRIYAVACLLALALVFLLSSISGLCAESSNSTPIVTNPDTTEPIPKLRPPLPEIPPTFWEQHGLAVSCAASALVVAGGYAGWRLTRPKPPVFIPPLQQAQSELEPLRNQPETGVLLSRVSQVVRHYFIAAFRLPAGELTTAEFCQAISSAEKLDPELASGVAGFLRQCDERKFAPIPDPPPLGAVTQAARFMEQAESRRTVNER